MWYAVCKYFDYISFSGQWARAIWSRTSRLLYQHDMIIPYILPINQIACQPTVIDNPRRLKTLIDYIARGNTMFSNKQYISCFVLWCFLCFFISSFICRFVSSICPISLRDVALVLEKCRVSATQSKYMTHICKTPCAKIAAKHNKAAMCMHDDVIKWNYFPGYWPFVRGIHRSPVDSPHKSQCRGALIIFWSAPEQTVEQMIETVIWNVISLIMTSL